MDALLGINQAQNFAEFREAAALLSAPSQNLVYADVAGNIGYQLPGMAPRRGKGDGRAPAPGWDKAYDWRGMIPFAELPWDYNPPGGMLVAANQPVIGGQYPRPLGSRILLRLAQPGDPRPAAADVRADPGPGRGAALRRHHPGRRRPGAGAAQGQGRRPDGWPRGSAPWSAGTTPPPPTRRSAAYFNVVMHNLLKLTFRDELPGGALAGRRGPLERGAAGAAQAAAQPVVGRRDHAGGDRVPRRHPAAGHDQRPQGDHLADGAGHQRVGHGDGCTPSPCGTRRSGRAGSSRSRRCSTGVRTRSAAVRRWSTRWPTTPPRATP